MKLDVDELLTVPAVPPSAGPDRAFDPAPPDPRPLGVAPDGLLLEGVADDVLLLELDGALVHAPTATAMAMAAAATELLSFTERIEDSFTRWPTASLLPPLGCVDGNLGHLFGERRRAIELRP